MLTDDAGSSFSHGFQIKRLACRNRPDASPGKGVTARALVKQPVHIVTPHSAETRIEGFRHALRTQKRNVTVPSRRHQPVRLHEVTVRAGKQRGQTVNQRIFGCARGPSRKAVPHLRRQVDVSHLMICVHSRIGASRHSHRHFLAGDQRQGSNQFTFHGA